MSNWLEKGIQNNLNQEIKEKKNEMLRHSQREKASAVHLELLEKLEVRNLLSEVNENVWGSLGEIETYSFGGCTDSKLRFNYLYPFTEIHYGNFSMTYGSERDIYNEILKENLTQIKITIEDNFWHREITDTSIFLSMSSNDIKGLRDSQGNGMFPKIKIGKFNSEGNLINLKDGSKLKEWIKYFLLTESNLRIKEKKLPKDLVEKTYKNPDKLDLLSKKRYEEFLNRVRIT